MDERLAKLRDMLIDSTIEYLKEEVSDKSINSARAVLKDLAPREDIELSEKQAERIQQAMGDAPFKIK
ncbi:MAG: hypothetical protein CML12_04050 [Puniceicoccaceae bacterium]|jgi:hypothetical protein|nr:hypothetical protein [Puniceicoccaceae bacterium]|tara:strand:+ start:637 stop:840 length:204 start_codon:yes stop_codon:yes gene_type:complete